MSTPVLTKKQQKHTLSAKKGAVKGLRHVLAQPQENYWPVVKGDQCAIVENLLKQVLPSIKRPLAMVPWSQLKCMKREERVQAKKEALVKTGIMQPDENLMKSVVTGVNAITRALEKDSVCCVLLDANVEPALLVKHVVTMAQNKKVLVLLIPCLKTITLQSIGFATAAFALKNNVMEASDHHFHMVYKKVLEISENFPPPTNSLHLLKTNKLLDDSSLIEDSSESDNTEEETSTVEPKKIFTLSTDVYKYRTSRKDRAFVPGAEGETTTKENKDSMEFISISRDSDSAEDENINTPKNMRYISFRENEKKEKPTAKNKKFLSNLGKRKGPNVSYMSLKVKRIQGNSNRIKATKFPKQKKK